MAACNHYLKLEGKRYHNNFQEHDFLRGLKIPPFSSLLRSGGKRAVISLLAEEVHQADLAKIDLLIMLCITKKYVKYNQNWFIFYCIFRSFAEPLTRKISQISSPRSFLGDSCTKRP